MRSKRYSSETGTAIMTGFWGWSMEIDITILVELYEVLIHFIFEIRDNFDDFENKAKKLPFVQEYERDVVRNRKRKLLPSDTNTGILSPEEDKVMCPKCGKKYPRLQLLTHVQFECGKQTVLQCPLCPRKCKRDDILQSHLRNIHRIN
ncbi:unnamed protein product [Acanthoscelides obtectus]|uniref:C2H2-type domain-containing protein n=1 Tax=Acanthoscelides obtectus TaxID=200917 RepID=A0A9P0P2F1_ACAOB|nr:unnamed protein product [Acanthoscelides obtectus]CAK1669653.1 hypothetical protein AOBTE_LOCUS27134 [Acanthoscelides obtectus]